MLKKDFVTFYSPGSFCAETTTLPISGWNEEEAIELSKDIVERYGAKPYRFQFTTRGREDDELDSRIIAESGMYYINGVVKTLADVEADPIRNRTLISNMKTFKCDRVVETYSPYRWVQFFEEGDKVVEVK